MLVPAPRFNPTTVIWYEHPAEKWENAFPVGNGRLGAMVFGRSDEERIQVNEETYWTGGPYNQTKKGGKNHLAEIRKLIFDGDYRRAHYLFGHHLMGYPVEQQKYQSLANLILNFEAQGEVQNYRHQLDLDSALITTSYEQNGVLYKREVFSSPACLKRRLKRERSKRAIITWPSKEPARSRFFFRPPLIFFLIRT